MFKRVAVAVAVTGMTLALSGAPAQAVTWHKFSAAKKGVAAHGQWARLGKNRYQVKVCVRNLTKNKNLLAQALVVTNGWITGEGTEDFFAVRAYGTKAKCATRVIKGARKAGESQQSYLSLSTVNRKTGVVTVVNGSGKRLY